MSLIAYRDAARIHTLRRQAVHLRQQAVRVDRDPVADDTCGTGAENAGWDEVEAELALRVNNRVAGVIPPREAHYHVGLLGQHVDYLPLPFVAPMGPDDYDGGHGLLPKPVSRAGRAEYSKRRFRWKARKDGGTGV